MKCKRCDGCGQIANSTEGEPWVYWQNLPMKSATAALVGIIKPIECPDCNGTGVVVDGHRWSIQVGDFTHAKEFTDLEEFLDEINKAVEALRFGKTVYLKKIAVFLPHD